MKAHLFHGAASTAPTTLYAGGSPLPTFDREQRTDLLRRSRAGEHLELELDAVTFTQRRGKPNRNHISFEPEALPGIAATGVGTPFLRDHAQRSQAARGGTIVASTLETLADGALAIRQRVRLTVPWAIQGALEASIDRFSIGWHVKATTTISCSACERDDCDHVPGQLVRGVVVEAVLGDVDLVETSVVNVPAVVDTGIVSISRLATTLAAQASIARDPSASAAAVLAKAQAEFDRWREFTGRYGHSAQTRACRPLDPSAPGARESILRDHNLLPKPAQPRPVAARSETMTKTQTDGVYLKTGDQAWLTVALSTRQLQQIASLGITEQAWRQAMARGGSIAGVRK